MRSARARARHAKLTRSGPHHTQLCPKCREPILAIRPDTEFDDLLEHAGMLRESADGTLAERRTEASRTLALYRTTLRLPPASQIGLTIGKWKHGPGVRVKGVVDGQQAERCGLKVGDVIAHVNGAPVRHTDKVMHYLNALAETRTDESVALLLLPRAGGATAQPGHRTINI
jgi:C-terminal processing protease CtpA/Prc